MQTQTHTPLVVPAGQGRTLDVLGHTATLKLTTRETGGDYFLFELVTPPGLGIPPHVHEREDEILSIVEGEFEVRLGDRTHKAGAGTLLHLPRRIPHGFSNVGAKPGKTSFTVVPGANFEVFFEELAALPKGEPDMPRVVEIFAKYGLTILDSIQGR